VYDAQFPLLALLHFFAAGPVAVQALHALIGQVPQIGLVSKSLRDVHVREVIVVVFQIDVTLFGDEEGVVEGGGR